MLEVIISIAGVMGTEVPDGGVVSKNLPPELLSELVSGPHVCCLCVVMSVGKAVSWLLSCEGWL